MIDYTVIITHFRREQNLNNCLQAVSLQFKLPREVIIINIGPQLKLRNTYNFKIKIVQFPKYTGFLPVAAARNMGALYAKSNQLVFLDVDCIPSKTFCHGIAKISMAKNSLVMGTPKYMLVPNINSVNFPILQNNSVYHPNRPRVRATRPERCYELFWSLCFSIPYSIFKEINGFDERYSGYGVEDTDFALRLKEKDKSFFLCELEVFHQQHPIYVPPLNHLESIVSNCNIFHRKWGYWPMDDCLSDFSRLGYIGWKRNQSSPIQILAIPSESTLIQHLIKNAPYR